MSRIHDITKRVKDSIGSHLETPQADCLHMTVEVNVCPAAPPRPPHAAAHPAKMDVKDPEKKIPFTAAKATGHLPKVEQRSAIHVQGIVSILS